MTTWLISRHPGAIEWARREGIAFDRQLDQLELERLASGDVVIGNLPIHLVAAVFRRGARYLHLCLHIPRDSRGRELDARQMEAFGARLEEFIVQEVAAPC